MHMKSNLCAGAVFLCLALAARAQTTAFTYQGQLSSNSAPVTGAYDLRFQLYNASSVVVRTADKRDGGRHERLVHRDIGFWPGRF
jgi:hypothetical protein